MAPKDLSQTMEQNHDIYSDTVSLQGSLTDLGDLDDLESSLEEMALEEVPTSDFYDSLLVNNREGTGGDCATRQSEDYFSLASEALNEPFDDLAPNAATPTTAAGRNHHRESSSRRTLDESSSSNPVRTVPPARSC